MKYINFAAANAQYYATITFDDTNYGGMKCVSLDCINDITVNSQSQITQFPLVSGKISADHIIQQPRTVTMSGKFGRNASYSGTNTTIEETFKNIQRLFERIKNQGYLCTIQKVHRETTDFETFDELKNMVLTSITWTEQNNTMNFNFTFTEVLLVSVVTATYEDADKNAPAYGELQTANANQVWFTEERVNWLEGQANNVLKFWENAESEALADTPNLGILGTMIYSIATSIIGNNVEKKDEQAAKEIEQWASDPQKVSAMQAAVNKLYSSLNVYTISEDRDQIMYLDDLGIKFIIQKNKVSSGTCQVNVYDYNRNMLIGQTSNAYAANWNFKNSKPIADIGEYHIHWMLKDSELRFLDSDSESVTNQKKKERRNLTHYMIVVTKETPETFIAKANDLIAFALGYKE